MNLETIVLSKNELNMFYSNRVKIEGNTIQTRGITYKISSITSTKIVLIKNRSFNLINVYAGMFKSYNDLLKGIFSIVITFLIISYGLISVLPLSIFWCIYIGIFIIILLLYKYRKKYRKDFYGLSIFLNSGDKDIIYGKSYEFIEKLNEVIVSIMVNNKVINPIIFNLEEQTIINEGQVNIATDNSNLDGRQFFNK